MAQPPAPKVLRALRGFELAAAPRYFDGYYGSSLAPELARRFKVPRDRVSIGYGVEFFLRSIFDSCRPERDVVLANAPHYTFYSVYAKAKNIRLETFGMLDRGDHFAFDVDDCLKKIRQTHPKVILITSPNNPTGNSISPKDFERVLRAAPKTTLIVLDEAYWGFDEKYDESAFLRLLKKYENVVILRSFSKRYALAGLRIGFALWGARAKAIIRFDDLYLGGSRLLEEIALAALDSEPYYRKITQTFLGDRKKFIAEVNKLKYFTAYASTANFVAVKVNERAKKSMAAQLENMETQIAKFISPDFMRVSLGSCSHIAGFVSLLKKIDAIVAANAITSTSASRHA
jgi:histidinol-phosphate aminotransferase